MCLLSNGSGHLVQWDALHWYCRYILESLPWHTRTRNFTSRYVCGIRTNRGYKNFAPNVVNAWKKQRSHPDLLLWPLQCRQTSTPCQDTEVSPRGEVQGVKPFYCFVSVETNGFPPPSVEEFITIIATHPFQNLKVGQVRQSEPLSKHLVPRRTAWFWILESIHQLLSFGHTLRILPVVGSQKH